MKSAGGIALRTEDDTVGPAPAADLWENQNQDTRTTDQEAQVKEHREGRRALVMTRRSGLDATASGRPDVGGSLR